VSVNGAGVLAVWASGPRRLVVAGPAAEALRAGSDGRRAAEPADVEEDVRIMGLSVLSGSLLRVMAGRTSSLVPHIRGCQRFLKRSPVRPD
jgi:hypothetical protein